jgi:GNAT acetyltransferase 2
MTVTVTMICTVQHTHSVGLSTNSPICSSVLHRVAVLLQVVALLVASHYKNTPNDLLLLADAPAHRLFVLLGPVDETTNELPDVLAVVQVRHAYIAVFLLKAVGMRKIAQCPCICCQHALKSCTTCRV